MPIFKYANISALIVTVVFGAASQVFGVAPISETQFEKIRTLVKPKSSEQNWEKISWRTSLWEARQQAAAEGKPILLWEMDGHPLGCT